VLGRRRNDVVPETRALDLIDATYEREVQPRELVVVDRHALSITSARLILHRPRRACIFEYIRHDLNSEVDVHLHACFSVHVFLL
jgi:amidophosphoribosyltransferase